MGTLNDIFKKLEGKTELSSHEVHLSTIKELQDAIKLMQGFESGAEKVVDNYEKKIGEVTNAYNLLLNERNIFSLWANGEAVQRLNKFERAAKELGLEINNVSEVIALKKEIQNTKDLIKALDSYKAPNRG
jgi:ABC-type Fe2+-enterobactin transport system substrate-binding protein